MELSQTRFARWAMSVDAFPIRMFSSASSSERLWEMVDPRVSDPEIGDVVGKLAMFRTQIYLLFEV